jgi:hypothetical protein
MVAQQAAAQLDGVEVRTAVKLQIATGSFSGYVETTKSTCCAVTFTIRSGRIRRFAKKPPRKRLSLSLVTNRPSALICARFTPRLLMSV